MGVEKKEVEVVAGDDCEAAGCCSPVHVLVVDDCFVDRKIVEKLLKRASFQVTTVDSGKKAIEVLGLSKDKADNSCYKDKKIDMILTDYCMPGMNGYDLLVAIKENSATKSLPVVMMSSEYDANRISRCLAHGAEDFLSKPLKVNDMQKLRNYVTAAGVVPTTKMTKRKVTLDLAPESNASERRPRLAGVIVA